MHKTPVYKTDQLFDFLDTNRARIVETEAPHQEPRVGQRVDTASLKGKRLLGVGFSFVHPKRPRMRFSFHTTTTTISVEMNAREWQLVLDFVHDMLESNHDEWIVRTPAEQRRHLEYMAQIEAQRPARK